MCVCRCDPWFLTCDLRVVDLILLCLFGLVALGIVWRLFCLFVICGFMFIVSLAYFALLPCVTLGGLFWFDLGWGLLAFAVWV